MFIAALALATATSVIDSIRIESRWGGLGNPYANTYTIVRRGGRYRRRSATVAKEAVDRFAAALTAAPVGRKAALRALATPEWLNARAAEPHPGLFVPVCSPDAKRLLAEHLADAGEAVNVLGRYFLTSWTDDYPRISVDVTFDDRQKIHLESTAQHALMLPWKVGSAETWNPEIPRAIAALLPDDAEPRLTERHLAREYVERVAHEMSAPIDDLEERCVHRKFLTAVEKQFEVVRIYHGSSAFTAYVRRPEFPANVVLTLVEQNDDKVDAEAVVERTIRLAREYVDIVRDYVRRSPEKSFAIWCADGVSVDGNDHAVKLYDYDPGSGTVGHSRVIDADGRVIDGSR